MAGSPERLAHRCGVFLAVAAFSFPLLPFARAALATRFNLNDWEWLWNGQDWSRELNALTHYEIMRPVSFLTMAASYHLFGLNPAPISALYLVINILGALTLYLVFLETGLSAATAFVAVAVGFFCKPNEATHAFVVANDTQLGRFWVALTLLALLRSGKWSRWLWAPCLIMAVGTYETWVVIPPLYLLSRWYRGESLHPARLAREPKAVAFGIASVGFLLLSVTHYVVVGGSTHQLGLQMLGTNVEFFLQQAGRIVTERSRERLVDLGIVSLVLLVVTRALARGKAVRYVVFAISWSLVAYVPFLFAISYRATHFLGLSAFGLGLFAGLGPFALSEARLPTLWTAWAQALVWPLFVIQMGRPVQQQRPSRSVGDQLVALTNPLVTSASGRPVRVFFLQQGPPMPHGPSPFENAISAQYGEGLLFQVAYPNGRVTSAMLRDGHRPWLCPSAEELAVDVEIDTSLPDAYRISLSHPCSPGDSLPPALRSETPAEGVSPELWGQARAFWSARARGNTSEVTQLGAQLVSPRSSFCHASGATALMLQAIDASLPREASRDPFEVYFPSGYWGRDDRARCQ